MSASSTLVSAGSAVLAGLFLAGSGVLQQRAASRRPDHERLSWRLAAQLLQDRTWLAGMGCAAVSYGFQALALAFGPLVLVQPLVVFGAALRGPGVRAAQAAAPAWPGLVRGRRGGRRARGRDRRRRPRHGHPIQPFTAWVPALAAVAAVSAGCLVVARVSRGPPTASSYALAGAAVMGLQSAVYAATIALLKRDVLGVFGHWEAYALILASLLGAFLRQNAFQSGPLAASTPVIDATLPVVAIGLGVGLFGEPIRTSAPGLSGAVVGVVLVIGGIVALDTSPVVRREHRIEQEERAGDPAG